jgi:glycosyltransferase involved in cell wall biosynthesis
MSKNVVLIPTYNESESILTLIQQLERLDVDIIVIDDNSPDGTADLVKNLDSDSVKVINHGSKNGIGPAYLTGMNQAITAGYEKIITMDADGSHLVEDVEVLISKSANYDVIMGTRWIPGGEISNWSISREFLSRFGTWYARTCLNLPFKDLTGGLRIYDAKSLKKLNLVKIRSNGYCFQIEMIKALYSQGATIYEVPIHFIERRAGKSKMSANIVIEAFIRVSLWAIKRILSLNADKLHYVK